MKRALVFLALPLPLVLGGCVVGAAEASTDQAPTIAEQCASVEASVPAGNFAGLAQNELFGCGNFHLGEGMSGLRSATVTWDEGCLSGHGYRVGEDGQPVAIANTADSRLDINECAALALTSEECSKVAEALSKGTLTYRPSEAASLTALGCSSESGVASTSLG